MLLIKFVDNELETSCRQRTLQYYRWNFQTINLKPVSNALLPMRSEV